MGRLYLERRLSERNFTILTAVFVGLCSGLAAVVLKNLIHYVGKFVIEFFSEDSTNFLYLFLPFIGVLLSYLYVNKIVKDNISHGVSKVLHAISKKAGKLNISKTYSSVIASSITIGFGGSVGPEAPVVLTGAAIGSNIGRSLNLDYKNMLLLIACGSAGAIAGIFGAPIAGLVFALEVLMIDLTMSSLLPLLLATLSGAVVSLVLSGGETVLRFDINGDFLAKNLPIYLGLGLFCGLVSHYFLRVNMKLEDFFASFKKPVYKILFGGLSLCLLIYFFPPLYGEGLNFVSDIIEGNGDKLLNNTFLYTYKDSALIFLSFILVVMLLKVFAMSFTNGGGGVGGVFAPSLFVGAFLGLFVARGLNSIFPSLNLAEANFALTGMAGVMAGVMHAPLTAIFLVAEITGGYKLFIPLILVSSIGFLVNLYFNPHSIYTKRLAEKGELFTHNKDTMVLSLMRQKELIESNFICLLPTASLGDLVKAIGRSSRNIFPIVDEENKFLGLVFLDEVKPLIFDPSLYNKILVSEIMFKPNFCADISDSMEEIAQKFLNIKDYNIPILDGDKYVGFLSRANVFSVYRTKIKELSND